MADALDEDLLRSLRGGGVADCPRGQSRASDGENSETCGALPGPKKTEGFSPRDTRERPFECNSFGRSRDVNNVWEDSSQCQCDCTASVRAADGMTETQGKPVRSQPRGRTSSGGGPRATHANIRTERPSKCRLSGTPSDAVRAKKSYLCPVCGAIFARASRLTRHERTHTGERPFECELCGRAFVDSCSLRMHMRSHTGERPFECQDCGKAFTRSGDLKRHSFTHTGERPYVCPSCGKAFAEAGHLAAHVRTHSGVRPFECAVCGKTFTRAGCVKRHMATHTGERPFVCHSCGKAFAAAATLRNHLHTHS